MMQKHVFRTLSRGLTSQQFNFVPKHRQVTENEVQLLQNFVNDSKKMVILTGAGISTESGIPDYRSAGIGLYERKNHKPILHLEFVENYYMRKRYWARNYVGWKRFSSIQPNDTHFWVKDMELVHKKVHTVVTQNVDNLHFKAGSQNVIELHGTGFKVGCLKCKAEYDRFEIQEKLHEMNPDFEETSQRIRPDGDVELTQDQIWDFNPPHCEKCNGILKPQIVFFGGNVPRPRVEKIETAISESDSILVLGSSLFVMSGYRIILQGQDEGKKMAIINIGPTRADDLVDLKISTKCSDILKQIIIE